MKINLNIIKGILLIFFIASCGKTTKGKMSNEWNVVSYEVSGKSVFSSDYYYGHSISLDQATEMIILYNQSPGEAFVSDTLIYIVNSNTMTINKDGTWKATFVMTNPDNSQATSESNGTWNFVRKNKEEEFKKNERVIFNTLSSKTTVNGTVTNSSTYLAGESIQFYNITESSKKRLILELEAGTSSTSFIPYNNNTNISEYTTKAKMVLEEK